MKPASHESTNGQSIPDASPDHALPRCSHRTATGRQCRSQARDTRSGLCLLHSERMDARRAHSSVTSELLGPLTEFKSARHINDFLSRLLLLLASDRVSPRRAAVMAYTCNLLLNSLRAMEREAAADPEESWPEWMSEMIRYKREAAAARASAANGPQEVIIDIGHPKRDPVSDTTGAPIKPS